MIINPYTIVPSTLEIKSPPPLPTQSLVIISRYTKDLKHVNPLLVETIPFDTPNVNRMSQQEENMFWPLLDTHEMSAWKSEGRGGTQCHSFSRRYKPYFLILFLLRPTDFTLFASIFQTSQTSILYTPMFTPPSKRYAHPLNPSILVLPRQLFLSKEVYP
jgi:hypothetical protein